MEVHEEVVMGSNKDHTHVIKGKRTKRNRPQSPIPFVISMYSSMSGDGGGVSINYANSSPDTSSSTEFRDRTEEEEDMANCLILLAQGRSRESPKRRRHEDDVVNGVHKFSTRRFLEAAAATTTGVYECKTCNRTFSSFQALGGHRASHKKPRASAAPAEERRQLLLGLSDEESQFKSNSPPLSLQLGNRTLYGHTKSKLHDCAICGAEFTSGQALGGHMRRHRAPVSGNTALSLTSMVADTTSSVELVKKPAGNFLSLDLNLPAPEDDPHRESKFEEKQQQSHLVFSTPTLVDCHY